MTPWAIDTGLEVPVPAPNQTRIPFEIFVSPLGTVRTDLPISKYEDDVWDLRPIAGRVHTRTKTHIYFADLPTEYCETTKRLAWCLINLRTPVEQLEFKASRRPRERLAVASITSFIRADCKEFFLWLVGRGIGNLSSVTLEVLEDYLAEVQSKALGRTAKSHLLFGVTRIWLLNPYLPPEDRLPMPPWEQFEMADLLGPPRRYGENRTPPIHPQTMSALLLWAERFITDFSSDIVSAARVYEGIRSSSRGGGTRDDEKRFDEYLETLATSGTPIPGRWHRVHGEYRVARQYLSGLLDIGTAVISLSRTRHFRVAENAPLPVEIRGKIQGEESTWCKYIDYSEAPRLRGLLASACLIVAAYLTGMRGSEVTYLQRGCIEAMPHSSDQPPRYRITGREFKGAVDDRGNSIPGGKVRERPWFTIEPVARAIWMAEQISGSDYVFDRNAFAEISIQHEGGPVVVEHTVRHIRDFIKWVNQYCEATNRSHEAIPPDPAGNVTLRRFRRTLAWFIYRLPGGKISLGLQYAHVRGLVTDGYGSRLNSGLRGLFPMEEALAVAEYLSEAAERLAQGEAVSGPAKASYLSGVQAFKQGYEGSRLSEKELNEIAKDTQFRIYDNPMQAAACCYDATRALCHPNQSQRIKSSVEQSPDLTRCHPSCPNLARTDRHVEALMAELKDLENLSTEATVPEPMRLRYQQRLESVRDLLAGHEHTKVGANGQ